MHMTSNKSAPTWKTWWSDKLYKPWQRSLFGRRFIHRRPRRRSAFDCPFCDAQHGIEYSKHIIFNMWCMYCNPTALMLLLLLLLFYLQYLTPSQLMHHESWLWRILQDEVKFKWRSRNRQQHVKANRGCSYVPIMTVALQHNKTGIFQYVMECIIMCKKAQ